MKEGVSVLTCITPPGITVSWHLVEWCKVGNESKTNPVIINMYEMQLYLICLSTIKYKIKKKSLCQASVLCHTLKNTSPVGPYLCLCSSCPPCPCMITCPEACLPSLGVSIWGISTSSKPRSKRLCLELSGRKKKAPKHKVMKALRIRRRMNFSESLNVALWCGKEEAPGDRVGILRPDSGSRAGVVMF